MGYQVGDKAGPRLASLIAQYVHAARVQTAPYESRIHSMATQRVIDRAGAEIASHYRPIVRKLLDLDDGTTDPAVIAFLEDAISGRHQLKAVGGLLTGAVAGTIGTFLSNQLAPLLYAAIRSEPFLNLDPGTLAGMVAAGVMSDADGANRTAEQGINNAQFERLVLLAQSPPGAVQLGDLVNRGQMSEAEALSWLERQAVPAPVRGRLLGLREALLPPDLAALAVLRGVISEAEGAAISARSGVSAADFRIIIEDTGEPLGLEQLQEARRRNFIDTPRLVRGILQSRVRNEWVDVAEKLAFSPASTADAVQAVVQGHLPFARGEEISLENGLEPGNFQWMYDTAGEPLSRTELEELFNRGEIDEATVKQGLRESRLKNKYVDDAFRLHVRLPEPRQIVSALTHGAITKADAMALLRQQGFSAATAAILIAEGSNARVTAHHGLTLAEIRALYTDRLAPAGQAETWLIALGYDSADARRLFSLWDFLAHAGLVRQAVGVVRAKFVTRHIDEQKAVLELDQLGIPADARDRYLRVWKLEQQTQTRLLSEAQIVKAVKLKLKGTSEAWGLTRLVELGYDASDALLLLQGA